MQDGLHRMELGMADKLRHLEETLNRLSDVLLASQEPPNHGKQHCEGHDGGRLVVSSKTVKLEFPRFSGDDPTEWFNRVNQFFKFQSTPEAQKALYVITSENLNAWPIGMFKPQSLKDAINLAWMRDDQLTRQWEFLQPPPHARALLALPPAARVAPAAPADPIRRLSWEEMQRKRAQGLWFNCNERFIEGHRCQKS
ncbi:hypothetical protein Pint_15208 [Pistacia integerrima]|uniref:Uncharacterized protein n=1 Tax=Pistacia integerrima TaxID=434235 RepID=A0ACC0ZC03_9ROSI|nr:hypothetical protein Pint_15208 [Pistacia integerrima]